MVVGLDHVNSSTGEVRGEGAGGRLDDDDLIRFCGGRVDSLVIQHAKGHVVRAPLIGELLSEQIASSFSSCWSKVC